MNVVLPVTPVCVIPLTVTEYGEVPPLTLTVTVPSLAPLQLAGVVVSDALIAVGFVIVTALLVFVQPPESCTVTVCEPDASPV